MIYIGVDQSKRYSEYTIGDERGNILTKTRTMNTEEGIRKLMDSLPPGPKTIGLEASRTWGWLYDQLEGYADKVLLGNPLQMKAIASAKVKTDSIDSKILYHLLRTDLFPTCFVPPKEIREIKFQLRFRAFLVSLRTSLKNRIHVLVDRNHVLQPGQRATKDLFCKKALKALAQVPLPERERQILDQSLKLYYHLKEQINTSKEWTEQLYETDPEAKLIGSIPGLGRYLSVLIRYEIGDIHRFRKAKKLCSYAGLTPSVYASGDKVYYGNITRRGNNHLRWALIEAVTPATTWDTVFRVEYERFKKTKHVHVARVAIARRILEWVYRVWKTGIPFQKLVSSQTALLTA